MSSPPCYLAPRRMLASGGPPCGAEPVSVYELSAHKSAPHGSTCSEKGAPMAEWLSDRMVAGWTRYIAIDLHKHYLMVAGIDASQRLVLPPRKLDLERWLAWAQTNLTATDAVVIEATANAWHIYDQLLALVGRIVVAHPRR